MPLLQVSHSVCLSKTEDRFMSVEVMSEDKVRYFDF